MPQIAISYSNPLTQFIQLNYQLENKEFETLHLQLPAWRPGRYELANYAQYLKDLRCDDPRISIKKITKDKWEITAPKHSTIHIEYDFYAARMDAGSSYLDENQLYINPINCIPYITEFDEAYTLDLTIPEEYKIATALEINANTLKAESYSELADSPFIASKQLQKVEFEEGGCEFFVWFNGKIEIDENTFLADFKKYTKEQIKLFGEFPCKTYHYLIQTPSYKHYHGVEHSYSTVITLGPANEVFTKKYNDLLGVSSHELFHTWNVCRIRPHELSPYDFSQERYFETGYIAEGITTYYGDYMLARSGVFDEKQFFKEINTYLKRHFDNAGRHNANLADSSTELWLDGYKQGTPGRKVSIYIKGALITLIADIIIRKATENKKSLDDVIRILWTRHGKTNKGYSSSDYKKYLEEVSGISFTSYFDKYVYGNISLHNALQDSFDYLGCKLVNSESDLVHEQHFGLRLVKKSHKEVITSIAENSPAEFSLMLNDTVVNINERGNEIVLEIERLGEAKTITLKRFDNTYFKKYTIEKLNKPSAKQLGNYNTWLSL